MILRRWQAVARVEREAAYLAHFDREVLPQLRRLAGFRGVTVLRRAAGGGTEITVLTRWESMSAVRGFAGDTPDAAVVAPEAEAFFVSYDRAVTHHEVVADRGA